jgi:hypothetical protein
MRRFRMLGERASTAPPPLDQEFSIAIMTA